MAELQYITNLSDFDFAADTDLNKVFMLVSVQDTSGGYVSKKISYQTIQNNINTLIPSNDVDLREAASDVVNRELTRKLGEYTERLTNAENRITDLDSKTVKLAGSETQTISRPTVFSTRPTLGPSTSNENEVMTRSEIGSLVNTTVSNMMFGYKMGDGTSKLHKDTYQYYMDSTTIKTATEQAYGQNQSGRVDNTYGDKTIRYLLNVKDKFFVYHRVQKDCDLIIESNHNSYVFSAPFLASSVSVNLPASGYAKDIIGVKDSPFNAMKIIYHGLANTTGNIVTLHNVKAGSDIWVFFGKHRSPYGWIPKLQNLTKIDVCVMEIYNGE